VRDDIDEVEFHERMGAACDRLFMVVKPVPKDTRMTSSPAAVTAAATAFSALGVSPAASPAQGVGLQCPTPLDDAQIANDNPDAAIRAHDAVARGHFAPPTQPPPQGAITVATAATVTVTNGDGAFRRPSAAKAPPSAHDDRLKSAVPRHPSPRAASGTGNAPRSAARPAVLPTAPAAAPRPQQMVYTAPPPPLPTDGWGAQLSHSGVPTPHILPPASTDSRPWRDAPRAVEGGVWTWTASKRDGPKPAIAPVVSLQPPPAAKEPYGASSWMGSCAAHMGVPTLTPPQLPSESLDAAGCDVKAVAVCVEEIARCAQLLHAYRGVAWRSYPLPALEWVRAQLSQIAQSLDLFALDQQLAAGYVPLSEITQDDFWRMPHEKRLVFMKICPLQKDCNELGCVRLHGSWDRDQDLEFRLAAECGDDNKGYMGCRDQLLDGGCYRRECGYRHFAALRSGELDLREPLTHLQRLTLLYSYWNRVSRVRPTAEFPDFPSRVRPNKGQTSQHAWPASYLPSRPSSPSSNHGLGHNSQALTARTVLERPSQNIHINRIKTEYNFDARPGAPWPRPHSSNAFQHVLVPNPTKTSAPHPTHPTLPVLLTHLHTQTCLQPQSHAQNGHQSHPQPPSQLQRQSQPHSRQEPQTCETDPSHVRSRAAHNPPQVSNPSSLSVSEQHSQVSNPLSVPEQHSIRVIWNGAPPNAAKSASSNHPQLTVFSDLAGSGPRIITTKA
jgi:hypothetical protein